jgi:hypothetical protein
MFRNGIFLLVSSTMVLLGCVTTQEATNDTILLPGGMKNFVLLEERVHTTPMYNLHEFRILDDEQIYVHKGYDINFDGRINMLEVYDLSGSKMRYRLFDFNADGRIDRCEGCENFEGKTMPSH